jgi:hypothetical protein
VKDTKIIDENTIECRELIFRCYPYKKYYKCTRNIVIAGKRRSPYLHQYVWWLHNGYIPSRKDGLTIHHKDEDISNNEIENLEVLTNSSHLEKHWDINKEQRTAISSENINKAIIAAQKWSKTPEGKIMRRKIGEESWLNENNYTTLTCEECGSEFTIHVSCLNREKNKTRFCSKKCQTTAYIRENKDSRNEYRRKWRADRKAKGLKVT